MSNPIAVRLTSFLPPGGIAFVSNRESPIASVSHDLCKVAAFLQELQPNAKLTRFDDWWQHDGLYFERGSMDFHAFFGIIGTPRSLLESMPGDDFVFVGISGYDRAWYLRFFVDWDEKGEQLLGEFSITLDRALAVAFQSNVLPFLYCPTSQENSAAYFGRIMA